MKLIGCGDSWCWGAELVDPKVEPVPIMTLPDGGFDRQFKPENIAYRLKYRYVNQLANKINAEVIDLSQPAYSNDAIFRRLIEYLVTEGYTSGKDTSDILVSIGWTSPERREFFNPSTDEKWLTFGPWINDVRHKNKNVNKFFKLYYQHFSDISYSMNRYITHIWLAEQLLKKYNIKYIMHQAFYHIEDSVIEQWNDTAYLKETHVFDTDKIMWDLVDPVRFLNKNNSTRTAHNIMLDTVNGDRDKVFEVMHPNANGHNIFANYLFDYIKRNGIL